MKRRDFFKRSAALGAGLATTYFIPGIKPVYAKPFLNDNKFDLAAVKGGEPEVMFDKAIESFGGLKSFIKPNQKVVVKPNIGWDAAPERAANTNPKLVGHIVKRSYEAGAKEVLVFDHTCDEWKYCYKNSLIEKYVIDNGGKIVPGNEERYYQDIEIKDGRRMSEAKIHELILDTDVFINVPVLKNHGGATLSLGMKNLMGIVWDRRWFHRNDLHQSIADFTTARIPDLTVIDGYNMMKRNGPRGVSVEDVVQMKSMVVSRDIVAADAAATKIFGLNPEDIGHIKIADDMGIGTMDLQSLNINRIKI